MTANTEVEARIQRGIAFLEEQVGPGWKSLVDVKKLDLGSPLDCVLGQVFADRVRMPLFSGYDYARHYVFQDYDDVIDHGFDRLDSAGESYVDLQAAWERVLTDPTDGGE